MMEIWNEAIVEKSWRLLQYLHRRYDFVLIGGWAIYFYTKSLKSKDIDFVTTIEELKRIGLEMNIHKNERLRKYEIKLKGIDVDIYIPYWSKLIVPPEDIIENARIVEGFKIADVEDIIILKLDAEIDRKRSIKGFKDRVDIIALLLSGFVDKERLHKKIHRYGGEKYLRELERIIVEAQNEFYYLGINNPRDIKKFKNRMIKNL